MTNVRNQMIHYKKNGQFTAFMKNVCKLNKNQLLEFCSKLNISEAELFASGEPSYDTICNTIIKKRPDLFREGGKWNYWSLIAALNLIPGGVVTTFWGFFLGFGMVGIIPLLAGVILAYKGNQWKNQRGIAIDYLKNNPELARRIRSRSRSQSRRKSRRRSS